MWTLRAERRVVPMAGVHHRVVVVRAEQLGADVTE
jgi:hypothetical protein